MTETEFTGRSCDGRFNQRCLGPSRALHLTGPFLELAVRGLEDKKDIVDVRPGIVRAVVPVAGAFFQCLVIPFFVLFDHPFQADVAADFKPQMVTLQEKQQPRDSSVAVAERMDAEEIEISWLPAE